MAILKTIIDRNWTKLADFNSAERFSCGASQEVNPEIVLLEPGWVLFTLEIGRDKAVFVKIAAAIDLSQEAFVYNKQFEVASHLLIMDLATFTAMGEQLPDPRRLVQFHNIGHCGSTLLHKVLNAVPGVWCVSEPVAFIDLAFNRQRLPRNQLLALARSVIRFVARYPRAGDADCVIIKQFSQSTAMMELLQAAAPQTKNIFMYRDALSWSNSFFHFVQKHGTVMHIPPERRSLMWRIMSAGEPEDVLDGIVDKKAAVVTFDVLAAVAWANFMKMFWHAEVEGVPLFALRYNELMEDKRLSLVAVIDYLGFPPVDVSGLLPLFEAHSHEGTRSARTGLELSFTPENDERMRATLAHEKIGLHHNLVL